jgi:hypothetical protein
LQALLADAAEPVEPAAVPEPVTVVSEPTAVAKKPAPTTSSTRQNLEPVELFLVDLRSGREDLQALSESACPRREPERL